MLDWLYPQTVEIIPSKVNGEIKVVKSRGHYSVWVGGFEQSGSVYVEKLWRQGLGEVEKYFSRSPKNVLILGFGCGTAAKLISQKWPSTHITGIELDPVMIRLGKKYFGLDKIKSLNIIINDAARYTAHLKQKNRKFDLVLVDTYLGNKFGMTRKKFPKLGELTVINSLEGTKNTLVYLDQ